MLNTTFNLGTLHDILILIDHVFVPDPTTTSSGDHRSLER
jgi:hypothetical protein